MTTLREAAQMALDVLEKLNKDGWILADFEDEVCASIEALRAALAQPEQEDGYCQACEGNYCTAKDGCVARDNPPQREWQGLTNAEVNMFSAGCNNGNSVQDSIRKAEAKLKEKNT